VRDEADLDRERVLATQSAIEPAEDDQPPASSVK
jgi:hypothetical protein